ncbi:MAG: insulinase family protein [Sediminicola sp.]
MHDHYRHIAFIIVLLSLASPRAQTNLKPDPLPLDSSIRYGRLDNGLTYFIKPLAAPQPKLYLRLIVRAGGNQEDKDQWNISHALEHMAFRSSKNFPLGLPNDKERIEKLKMRNYRDFSGGNSSYFTQYIFDAPVNDPYALETCLLWFKDIANGSLNLTEEDIDKERGALRQEFISKEGKNLEGFFTKMRLLSQIYPGTQDYTHFFEHNRRFSPKALRRYYKDWYRPDLMAISVVGNVDDVAQMENMITGAFSDIVPPKYPKTWKDQDSIYYHQAPTFVQVERQIDPTSTVRDRSVEFLISFRDPFTRNTIHTSKGLQRILLWQLLTDALQARFNQLRNDYNADLGIFAKYSLSYKSGDPMALTLFITSENGNEMDAVKTTVELLHQMKKFGLQEGEWQQIQQGWLRYLDRIDVENGEYWSNEINKHFIFGEALPMDKPMFLKEWLSELSLEKFNALVATLIREMPEDIGIIAPPRHSALSLNEHTVRSLILNTWTKQVEPYTVPEIPHSLMDDDQLSKLKIKNYKDKGTSKNGAKEVVLDNGIRLVLMPNKSGKGLKGGKVRLHGFSPNGAACFPKEDYFTAINSPLIVRHAGVGSFDKFKLQRFQSETSFPLGLQPYIDVGESGIKGEAVLEDLEPMLQLVYLYFSHPRKDKEAFEDWKRGKELEYQDPPYGLIDVDFKNAIKEVLGNGAYKNSGTKQFNGLSKIDLDRAYNIYTGLFGRARDFTFMVSGNFSIDSLLPLAQKYLGNLPNAPYSLVCNSSTTSTIPKGPISKKIIAPYEMKNITYGLQFIPGQKVPFDWGEAIKVGILGGLVRDRVWSLRYDKGYALYTITGSGLYDHGLSKFRLAIKFNCEKRDLTVLQNEIQGIIQEIKSGDINRELFEQQKMAVESQYSADAYAQTMAVQQRLYDHYRYGYHWPSQREIENYIKTITMRDIMETAKKYYMDENRYEFVMGN